MSRKYKLADQQAPYFVSFATVNWVDVFTRNSYREILIGSIQTCQREKRLQVHAWCIMTNHVHLIISSNNLLLEGIMRDMKSFTWRTIKETIAGNLQESRREMDDGYVY
jgi:REP element-mobilizing transposase RayT